MLRWSIGGSIGTTSRPVSECGSFVESFNSGFRDECLNEHIFAVARVTIEAGAMTIIIAIRIGAPGR